MSFDPRSLERLQELGRQLPKPLEAPTPQAQTKPQRQHRVSAGALEARRRPRP